MSQQTISVNRPVAAAPAPTRAQVAVVEQPVRQAFWILRFGFTVAGVRPAYYSKPVEDALILWREDLPADRRP